MIIYPAVYASLIIMSRTQQLLIIRTNYNNYREIGRRRFAQHSVFFYLGTIFFYIQRTAECILYTCSFKGNLLASVSGPLGILYIYIYITSSRARSTSTPSGRALALCSSVSVLAVLLGVLIKNKKPFYTPRPFAAPRHRKRNRTGAKPRATSLIRTRSTRWYIYIYI